MGLAVVGFSLIAWLVLAVVTAVVLIATSRRSGIAKIEPWGLICGIAGAALSTAFAKFAAWIIKDTQFNALSGGDPGWGTLFTSIAAFLVSPLLLGLLLLFASALVRDSPTTLGPNKPRAALHYIAIGAMSALYCYPITIRFL